MSRAGHPLKLRRLRRISLRTPDIETARGFYVDHWGLEPADEGRHDSDDVVHLRGTGPEHHILRLTRADYHGIDHIAFAVETRREVEEAAVHLDKHGMRIVQEPDVLDGAAGGYGLVCIDPEGRALEISSDVRSNSPRNMDAPVPCKLAHVVLNTVDIDTLVEFYREVLGFRVSDWSEHQMAFMRINADHHAVAFNQAEWVSLNHMAYELPSLDHYMRAVGRLKRGGIEPLWGLGRHGPGNNTFAYFADPGGFVPELTSEVLQIDEEDWLPRVWQRLPDQADLWGTAGPPSSTVREHMAGTPDPGPFPEAAA